MTPSFSPPVVIIGTGIAGLMCALEVAPHRSVVMLTKSALSVTNTNLAQGGIAVAWGEQDSAALHVKDTLTAGGKINHLAAVEVLCQSAVSAVKKLIQFGVQFDRTPDGSYRLALEGAHSFPRVLHAGGDATGKEIQRALSQAALTHPNIQILEQACLVDLINHQGAIAGLTYLDQQGLSHPLETDTLVLASGGAGQVFSHTVNQPGATGESLVLAVLAGAQLQDIEFFQFHPTGLNLPGKANLLISEALRGEGAKLIHQDGVAFMKNYHPLGDLASRDVVSRAIQHEIEQTGPVFLDATDLQDQPVDKRFPNIFQRCLDLGVDARSTPLPVTPVAHYMMGGISTDLWGRTHVPGLYAVGEVTGTGVHGASRLASNSLLEGAVFGGRAAQAIVSQETPQIWDKPVWPVAEIPSYGEVYQELSRQDFGQLMWDKVGLVRSHEGLSQAIKQISSSLGPPPTDTDRLASEYYKMRLFALMMAQSALLRCESRGSHFRRDFTEMALTQGRSIGHRFFQPPYFI